MAQLLKNETWIQRLPVKKKAEAGKPKAIPMAGR
jgi:hypothetical protein